MLLHTSTKQAPHPKPITNPIDTRTTDSRSGSHFRHDPYYGEDVRRSRRVKEKEDEKQQKSSPKPKHLQKNTKRDSVNMAVRDESSQVIAYTQDVSNDTDIIIDSGASVHMFRNPTLLFNIRNKNTRIRFGNGKLETYGMVGDAGLLRDVVLSTKASKNIVSISRLTDIGFTISMKGDSAHILDVKENLISTATKRSDGLLYLDDMNIITPLAEVCHLSATEEVKGAAPNRLSKFHSDVNPMNVLHNRLGHVSEGSIKAMVASGSVIGLDYTYDQIKKLHLDPCDACMRGKMTKLPAKPTIQPTDYKTFEKMGSDIVGKMNVVSVQGNQYLILYIDY